MRLVKKFKLFYNFYLYGLLYQTPINLSYLWNFGSLAGLFLFIQIFTGLALTFWYVNSVESAFFSVEFIMREVNNGWLLRYMHANGASFFFIVVYFHIGRNLYFSSFVYPREKLWVSGVLIFLLMIIIAFLGYVLPWGQMSYWAATVITSLLSVVPFVGKNLLFFVWGGISIDQPTLTRVYGLHFFLPFVLLGLVILHIIFLHEHGSTNIGGLFRLDLVFFHPYFTYKDFLGFNVAVYLFLFIVCRYPNLLSHTDNYILANPGVTPTHIVPEWYFLPFYAILRSVPSKAGGVLLLLGAIFTLFVLPYFVKPLQQSGFFRPFFNEMFDSFIYVWFILGWSGGNPIETPFYEICQLATFCYFFYFLVYLTIVVYLENLIYIYQYITNKYISFFFLT